MKRTDERQFELGCDEHDGFGSATASQSPDADLARSLDKITNDTINNVRPYLNRMVKDVERLLEGSFVRTPWSNVLDDLIEGLERDIRKFVQEARALKRWSQSHPPESTPKDLR